ncbi:MAG: outer membrane protein insertion porin family [Cellvibrionaceae bacterium]|jgi:outer membrane protein insertion porin family
MKLFLLTLLTLLSVFNQASSEEYRIEDIQVLGLQRVSSETVFAAIDIEANSVVSDEQLQQAIRDLYRTGLFSEVSVGSNDNLLIFTVEERPVIASILVTGNSVIEEVPLLEGLKSIGLAEGEIFKPAALDAISKQLNAQYGALGRYSAQIETTASIVSNNQVLIEIDIDEGEVAKIKHINIVGNTQINEDELRGLFSLNTSGTWSWLTGSDKYARERLAGDLERLKSYYLDRGYLQFSITSTQVSLSPDKATVFITVNVDEGERFTVKAVDIAGDPVIPLEELQQLITIETNDIFSQLQVTLTEKAIAQRLANEGYSAVNVSGAPQIDDEEKTVDLTFYIRPGEISYVRRITFSGNTATADHVLRREMRQLEGAPISLRKLEQSRIRLQRLGLFSNVDLSTREVPGSTDQVDIEVTVTEQSTASVDLSLGYSGDNGISLGAGLQHNNWLGSGNTFGFNVQTGETETNYSLNFRNPYYTKDGVSRGISLYYRERDYEDIDISNYATDTAGIKVSFGYPVSETGRLSLGVGFENISVTTGVTPAQEILGTPSLRDDDRIEESFITQEQYDGIILELGEFEDTNNNGILDEGDNSVSDADNDILDFSSGDLSSIGDFPEVLRDSTQGFLDKYGDTFDTFTLDFGWSNSSLNRAIFPTFGTSQRLSFEVAVPGGDLEYYKLNYSSDWFFPIAESSALRLRGRFGYAEAYGDIDELPFFENFFAGGIGSVRGFEPRSLGPKATPAQSYFVIPVDLTGNVQNTNDLTYVYIQDEDGQLLAGDADDDVNTLGGNILVEFSAELVFPTPFLKKTDKLRTNLFIDAGNVFSDSCGASQRNCGSVDLGKLSIATGFGVQWLSPIGPIVFSYAVPLQEQPFDQTENFQFTLGRNF